MTEPVGPNGPRAADPDPRRRRVRPRTPAQPRPWRTVGPCAGRRRRGSRPRRWPPPGAGRRRTGVAGTDARGEGVAPLPRRPTCSSGSCCFGVFRFRIATSGQEHVPAGGYLLVAAAHRGWMDPFVVMHALPVEPRSWILGAARRRSRPRGGSGSTEARRRPAARLAWRCRHRRARRLGAGRDRATARCSSRCRGHGQRPAGSARPDADTAGRSSRSAPRHRSCRSRWPGPRSSTSAGGWHRASCRRRLFASWRGSRPMGAAGRGFARGARAGARHDRSTGRSAGPGRGGAPPVDRRPARPSASVAPSPDLAAPPAGTPRPRRLRISRRE